MQPQRNPSMMITPLFLAPLFIAALAPPAQAETTAHTPQAEPSLEPIPPPPGASGHTAPRPDTNVRPRPTRPATGGETGSDGTGLSTELRATPPAPGEEPSIVRPVVLVSGLVGAVSGAALLGLGAYQGAQAVSLRATVDDSTPQRTAQERYDRATRDAGRAQVLMIAGGVTLGIGAVLLALRFVTPDWLSPAAPSVVASISRTGASVAIAL